MVTRSEMSALPARSGSTTPSSPTTSGPLCAHPSVNVIATANSFIFRIVNPVWIRTVDFCSVVPPR